MSKEYLINSGQSEINKDFKDFCNLIPNISKIEDLIEFDKIFFKVFSRDASTPKFSRSILEIFYSKTFSGCSDIGLIVSAILREKGIPAVYVETAKIDWLEKVFNNLPGNDLMEGHIFLEIKVNDVWYLYDPTFRIVYLNYDINNKNYPRNYYVFAKGVNCNSFGVYSTRDERALALSILGDYDISSYVNPNYDELDFKDGKNKVK